MKRLGTLIVVSSLSFGCGIFGLANDLQDESSCIIAELAPSGVLTVDGASLDFDAAPLTSIDFSELAGSDECFTDVNVQLTKGGDYSLCSLSVETLPLTTADGELLIQSVSLSVNAAQCPTWAVPEGTYRVNRDDDGPLGAVFVGGGISGELSSCYEGTIAIRLEAFSMTDGVGENATTVTIEPSLVQLMGKTGAFGDSASCPTPA